MIKIAIIIILAIVALLLMLAGMGFFICSLYFYLLIAFHDPTQATFFCGLALLLMGILLLLLVIILKSSFFKLKAARVQTIVDNPCAEALHIVQEYPFRSSFVAIGVGFLLGFFPQLRNSLIDAAVTYLKTGSVADSLNSMKSSED